MSGLYDDLVSAPSQAASSNARASSGLYDDLVPTPMPPQRATPPEKASLADQAYRQAGLAARAVANGVAGLPLAAMDAGVAARNLLGDAANRALGRPATPDYELPSSMFEHSLDAFLPHPETLGERGAGAIEAALAGSRIPAPSIGDGAPANFVSPPQAEAQARAAVVQRGQNAGYVVPPATSNPTTTNRALETIAGKQATQQGASLANQRVTNTLAKQALGLNPDAPLTADSLAALRTEASQAGYAPIRAAGMLTAPENFSQRLAGVLTKYQGAERSFPGMGKTELSDIVQKVDRPQFDAGDAIDLTKILREKADAAFRAGDTGLGSGLRDISKTVEDAIDQGLQAKGPQYADALANFRNARRTIAQSYTVEDALNPGSNNVIAAKLAAALRKGAPLSGDLETAAQFASAFPKATAEPTHSMGVNHLDTYGAIGGALLGEHVLHSPAGIAAAAAVPLARMGSKAYLLSRAGQSGAVPSLEGLPPKPSNLAAALAAALNSQ
jgi:hypothetical protein